MFWKDEADYFLFRTISYTINNRDTWCFLIQLSTSVISHINHTIKHVYQECNIQDHDAIYFVTSHVFGAFLCNKQCYKDYDYLYHQHVGMLPQM
jgi:hypothetical protein